MDAYGQSGELSTWKDRIRVRESMARKLHEIQNQIGITVDDAGEFVDACHDETEAIPPKMRNRTDLDLVLARSLSRWYNTGASRAIPLDMAAPPRHRDLVQVDPLWFKGAYFRNDVIIEEEEDPQQQRSDDLVVYQEPTSAEEIREQELAM